MKPIFFSFKAIFLAIFFVHTASFAQTRTITFKSTLNDEKKGYKILIGTFKPSKFTIHINGHKIKDHHTLTVPIENNRFIIRYDYEFNAYLRTFKGYREVEFEVESVTNHFVLDFSWKHNDRFIISNAKFVRIVKIHEPGSEHASGH